jgi:hypothetical protein
MIRDENRRPLDDATYALLQSAEPHVRQQWIDAARLYNGDKPVTVKEWAQDIAHIESP